MLKRLNDTECNFSFPYQHNTTAKKHYLRSINKKLWN